jgi:hypothetical protein
MIQRRVPRGELTAAIGTPMIERLEDAAPKPGLS